MLPLLLTLLPPPLQNNTTLFIRLSQPLTQPLLLPKPMQVHIPRACSSLVESHQAVILLIWPNFHLLLHNWLHESSLIIRAPMLIARSPVLPILRQSLGYLLHVVPDGGLCLLRRLSLHQKLLSRCLDPLHPLLGLLHLRPSLLRVLLVRILHGLQKGVLVSQEVLVLDALSVHLPCVLTRKA